MNPVERAIEVAGSEAELARLTLVTPQAINKAKNRGKVGPDLALAIEAATGVSKESLVWPEEQGKKKPLAADVRKRKAA